MYLSFSYQARYHLFHIYPSKQQAATGQGPSLSHSLSHIQCPERCRVFHGGSINDSWWIHLVTFWFNILFAIFILLLLFTLTFHNTSTIFKLFPWYWSSCFCFSFIQTVLQRASSCITFYFSCFLFIVMSLAQNPGGGISRPNGMNIFQVLDLFYKVAFQKCSLHLQCPSHLSRTAANEFPKYSA